MEKTFPNLVRVPEPNMQMNFVAFAKRDIPISDWESLRGLRIGMVSGWKILERNTKDFPNVSHLLEVSDLFQMLEMDRLDVVLYSKLTGYEQLHKLELNNIYALSPPLCTKDMFLYLHKSHENLVAPLAKALHEMKQDGSYDQIVKETSCHLH
ncbi:substrate-binding periplasmic protein [Oleidesulfovibrio alaskensis]|jgi:polar amino acid transport system substrate-binding protein